MAKISYFVRYAIIVKELRRGEKTYDELRYAIIQNDLMDLSEYSQRTLQRDIKEIEEIFGLVIKCDKEGFYQLEKEESFLSTENFELLEQFDFLQTIKTAENYSDYLLPEKTDSVGSCWKAELLKACKAQNAVKFNYQSPWSGPSSNRTLNPYGLKEFGHKWYVIGEDAEKKKLRVFSLDRITDMKVIKERHFMRDPEFNIREYYKDSYGIYRPSEDEEMKAIDIELWADEQYGQILEKSPLHSSQTCKKLEYGYEIKLHVYPAWDFTQKLLTIADRVRVVSPLEYREELKETLMALWGDYDSEEEIED